MLQNEGTPMFAECPVLNTLSHVGLLQVLTLQVEMKVPEQH